MKTEEIIFPTGHALQLLPSVQISPATLYFESELEMRRRAQASTVQPSSATPKSRVTLEAMRHSSKRKTKICGRGGGVAG